MSALKPNKRQKIGFSTHYYLPQGRPVLKISIAALTQIDADAAEKAVLDLSEIYRATLAAEDTMTTLKKEVDLTERYLQVERLRMGDRLDVDWQLDENTLNLRMPALVMQPLVENAVYHGLEPREDGGKVRITSSMEDKITIQISNPLPAANDDTQRRGNQMAVNNIRERLKIAYGKQAGLKAEQTETDYSVTLYFPRDALQ